MDWRKEFPTISNRLLGLPNTGTLNGGEDWDFMGETKAARGSPPRDPIKREALIDNMNHLAPGKAAEIHRQIVERFDDHKAVSLKSVQGLYLENAPATPTKTVRYTAAVLGCKPDDLFTLGYWKRHRDNPAPASLEVSAELGGMMPDVEAAIEADPDGVAEASAFLMRSELRHLHAFFTHWMHTKLTRKRERKRPATASLQSQESSTRS